MPEQVQGCVWGTESEAWTTLVGEANEYRAHSRAWRLQALAMAYATLDGHRCWSWKGWTRFRVATLRELRLGVYSDELAEQVAGWESLRWIEHCDIPSQGIVDAFPAVVRIYSVARGLRGSEFYRGYTCRDCGEPYGLCGAERCDECGCWTCSEDGCGCEPPARIDHVSRLGDPVVLPEDRIEVIRRNKVKSKRGRLAVLPRPAGVEVECYAHGNAATVAWANRWQASIGDDGSIRSDHGEGMEVRTRAMGGDLLVQGIEELGHALGSDGAEVNRSCGLHVHVYSRDVGWPALLRTINLYLSAQDALYGLHPSHRETGQYSAALQWDPMRSKEQLSSTLYGEYSEFTKGGLGGLSGNPAKIGSLLVYGTRDLMTRVPASRIAEYGYRAVVWITPLGEYECASLSPAEASFRDSHGDDAAGRIEASNWVIGCSKAIDAETTEMPRVVKAVRPGCNWKKSDWGPERMGKGYHKRYAGLNVHSHFYRGSLEFRLGEGMVDSEDILSWTAICQAVVEAGTGFSTSEWKRTCDALAKSQRLGLCQLVGEFGLGSLFGSSGNSLITWMKARWRAHGLERGRRPATINPLADRPLADRS